ncbi:MAG: hypothetical protein FWD27_04985 [Coriobacteriia bacterium]|nr:hypothetical protein [Coriobacteriia bacterium]
MKTPASPPTPTRPPASSASSASKALAAERFAEEWHGRGQEDEHVETLWNQFLQEVMGIERVHHVIDYQKKVKVGKSTK